jgi:hypothetical protein
MNHLSELAPLAPLRGEGLGVAWRTVVEFGKLGGLLIEKAVAVLWYPMDYHKH